MLMRLRIVDAAAIPFFTGVCPRPALVYVGKMSVLVPIPGDLAARFGSETELRRRTVEALALEEYRAGRLTHPELRTLLGFATSGELDGFLKGRGVTKGISIADVDGQIQGLNSHPAADDLVAQFQAFAAVHMLGNLDIKALIREGRR